MDAYIYSYTYVRLSKPLVHEKDINIIWKGPIANHSFIAILPSLCNIDLQRVSLRLNTAVEVDMIYNVSVVLFILVSTSINCTKVVVVLDILAALILVKVVLGNWKH